MQQKSYFKLLNLILAILVVFIFSFSNTCFARKNVHIAFNIPITGPFGVYGRSVKDGTIMAMEDMYKLYPDVHLIYDIKDNAGKPRDTVAIFQKQFFHKVDIYVSGVKPQTMAIFDMVKQKGVPHFVWIFDAFICRNNKNTFRTWVSYKYEPEKYIQYIKYKKPKKIAITYVNLPHVDEEMKKIIFPELEKLGYNLKKDVLVEVYEWTQLDFKNIVGKFRAFKPDLMILNGFQGNLVGLVKSLRAYNMIHDGNVIGTYDMLDAAEILKPQELEGIRLIVPYFNISGEDKKLKNWKKRFEKLFDRKPLYTDAYAYDMIHIIADAASRINKDNPTSDDWRKALLATDTDGITGHLSFDKDGDLKLKLRIGVFRNGKIVLDECEKQQ